ncbi:zinc finger domain-containing protein [Natrinema gari]
MPGNDDQPDHAAARTVPCPSCGANPERKCKRPGGHRVRKCHAARVERAEDPEDEQTELTSSPR